MVIVNVGNVDGDGDGDGDCDCDGDSDGDGDRYDDGDGDGGSGISYYSDSPNISGVLVIAVPTSKEYAKVFSVFASCCRTELSDSRW